MREINQAGIDLLKQLEGCELTAYRDSVRVCTIGYGHTGPDVHDGLCISREHAEDLLQKDLRKFERAVTLAVTTELNDNQFAACVVFSYNVGIANFKSSTLLKKINEGRLDEVPDEFLRWDHAGGEKLPGLTRRREGESELFQTPQAS